MRLKKFRLFQMTRKSALHFGSVQTTNAKTLTCQIVSNKTYKVAYTIPFFILPYTPFHSVLAINQNELLWDNNVWGVNSQDNIFRYINGAWHQVPGAATYVGVGTDGAVGDETHVWGVNNLNNIYLRVNGDINPNGLWAQVGGALIDVSVASDGTVWGVNGDHNIYKWAGYNWLVFPSWYKLKQIYVSSQELIVGVNDNNEIYQYVNNTWRILDGSLKYVAISIDGILWGIDNSDNIYTRQDNLISQTYLKNNLQTTPNYAINDPQDVIIGLSVGLGLSIIIFTVAIVIIVRHYKKISVLRIAH
ncbi:17875_t:CDS:2 [Dentiscutata erythropus]|uniref:17875_t:CDS:1 n=1 Tax=Dentiscutata erythropus TaxID=1348616 RepID=A0A9N9AYI3_9GLOM|nr:17875_t:CDS:2 [Dentiscutata erythropus]